MANRVFTFHYTVKDSKGETLESSQGHDPLSILEGQGQILPKLEAEIGKMKAGDKKMIPIGYNDAYGPYREELVRRVPPKEMPKKTIKVGEEFEVSVGNKKTVVMVTSVSKDEIVLDGNHPLAGKDLRFEIEFVSTREASEEEMAHGHVHGAGGHHH
ncbi:MAG: peptidylprolyl isomerase [Bdellovibrionia bacterium]